MLWIFPTLGGLVILYRTPKPALTPRDISLVEWIQAVPIERWCAAGLVVAQFAWALLAVYFQRTETAREWPKGNSAESTSGTDAAH